MSDIRQVAQIQAMQHPQAPQHLGPVFNGDPYKSPSVEYFVDKPRPVDTFSPGTDVYACTR